MSSLNIS